jgi:hypothetical protein
MPDIEYVAGMPFAPNLNVKDPAPSQEKFKQLIKDTEYKQKKQKKKQEEITAENNANITMEAITYKYKADEKKFKEITKASIGADEKRAIIHNTSQPLSIETTQAVIEKNTTPEWCDKTTQNSLEEKVAEENQEIAKSSTPPKHKPRPPSTEKPLINGFEGISVAAPNFLGPAAPTTTTPWYTSIPPEILALFERIISLITVLKTSGNTKTTIHINDASQFSGSTVVIREFNTAANEYNIELIGSPQQVAIFEKHLKKLVQAFKTGRHAFRVNRITSRLSDPHFLLADEESL